MTAVKILEWLWAGCMIAAVLLEFCAAGKSAKGAK